MRQRKATAAKVLPANQSQALELIAAGAKTTDIASKLGVHRTTVWKWTQEPQFQDAVRSIREEALNILSEGLRTQAAKAVLVLGEQLDSDEPKVRRDAARIVLGSYARLRTSATPQAVAPPELTEEELEERQLRLWGFIEKTEEKRPGFIASNPLFASARTTAFGLAPVS